MLQTADVDAKLAAEDAETECLLVCGSLSCFAAAAATALAADAAMAAAATTAACGSSSCFAAAAALAAETTADANSKPVKLTRTGISARAIP